MFVSLKSFIGFLRIILIFSSYVRLIIERGHLLMVLLLLERVTLGVFGLLFFSLERYFGRSYLCLVFISFGACEASVGLSLLVCLIRGHGNDFVSSLTVYEC